MRIGLNFFPVRTREMTQAAVLADRLGYSSLWYGEHVAVPWEYDASRYPGDRVPFHPDSKILDPLALLATLAGVTQHIRLGSGISILPLHDPLLMARTLVTIDLLSNGRLDLGVGVGWMVDEFEFVRRDFTKRGEILDEFLDVLDVLWTEPRPEHHGKHFDFRPIGFKPKPLQQPRIPVHVGGRGMPSLRRAARYEGWYGGADTPEAAAQIRAGIDRHRDALGTSDAPFQMSVLLFWRPSRDQIDAYADAGVDQLVVTPWAPLDDASRALAGIEEFAVTMGMTPP
jgi:probable F420-dependent oxidoreductase